MSILYSLFIFQYRPPLRFITDGTTESWDQRVTDSRNQGVLVTPLIFL